MKTINELSATTLVSGDNLPVWSTANGDTRRVPITALLSWLQANFTTLGYAAGRGGTVTQITSRTTGVTLNRITGEIVLVAAAIPAHGADEFVLTNDQIAPDDMVLVSIKSGGAPATRRFYDVRVVNTTVGSAAIVVANSATVASPAEALALQFAIIKGARA